MKSIKLKLTNLLSSKLFYLNVLIIAYLVILHYMFNTNNTLKAIAIILVVCSVFIVTTIILLMVKNFRSQEITDQDVVVVLGSRLNKDQPKPTLVRRLNKGMGIALKLNLPIIVSGGMVRGETITEAQAMKDFLIGNGVLESRITTEDTSKSTYENLFNVMKLNLNQRVMIIVTSDFHACRVKLIAKSLNIEYVVVTTKTPFMSLVKNMYREVFALIKESIVLKVKRGN